MATGEISVTIECKKCGGKQLTLPDNPTDDSVAVCTSCGVEFGRWGDFKEAAIKTAKNQIIEDLQDTFASAVKGSKHVTFKKAPRKRR